MKEYDNIESIVRDHVTFPAPPSSKGWNNVYCEVCGDGSHTKGRRGGWQFADNIVFYNCFNCGVEGSFDPEREYPFSRHMYVIFKAFNVPLKYCYQLIDRYRKAGDAPKPVKRPAVKFEVFDIFDHLYLLNDAESTDKAARVAVDHLTEKRRIDPNSFPFMLSTGRTASTNPKDISIAKTLSNRLIIPAFRDNDIIGYEAMALFDQSPKYITLGSHLIHGYNNIFGQENHVPLFITEGFFDSYHFSGVALTTNKISKWQIELLDRTERPKVVIPDKGNTHNALAEKAIGLDWGVSFPDISPYKDVSEAIEHYGVIYVIDSALKSIKYGSIAEISLNLYNIR